MKLYERLGISEKWIGQEHTLQSIAIEEKWNPKTDFEKAWKKFGAADTRNIAAIECYLLDDWKSAKQHGNICLKAAEDFFFGKWRSTFTTPTGKPDPIFWNQRMIWMQIYEACLLWCSVFGEWELLKRLSEFPNATACVSDGYQPQQRDLFVSIAALVLDESRDSLTRKLKNSASGPNASCKLITSILNSLSQGNGTELNDGLKKYWQHYRKREFPKEKITKKISIEGTFLTNFGKRRGFEVAVPEGCEDFLVKIS